MTTLTPYCSEKEKTMKITVNTKSFAAAIDWATKSYDSKDSFSYVALTLDKDGAAHLFHTNLTSSMKSSLEVVDIDESGKTLSVALEGKFLQRLSGALQAASGNTVITFDPDAEKKTFEVKTNNGTYSVPLVDAVVSESQELVSVGSVNNTEYFTALQRLSKLCETQNADYFPVIGSVDIQIDSTNKKLAMMATDRYVLGEVTMSFAPANSKEAKKIIEDHPHFLLPFENATMIAPSKDADEELKIVFDSLTKKFGYILADGRIALFSLKSAEPLPYHSMKTNFSNHDKNSMILETNELRRGVGVISNLAWEESGIFFDISEEEGLLVGDSYRRNKLSVESADTDDVTGENRVQFLRSVISKVFSPIATKQMKVTWKDSESAWVFKAILDNGEVDESVFVFAVPNK